MTEGNVRHSERRPRMHLLKNSELKKRILLRMAAPIDDILAFGRDLSALKERGHEQFGAFLDRAGIKQRHAYYVMELGRRITMKVPKARLEKIGWTKLMIIAPDLTAKNLEARLMLAEENTAHALKAIMKGETPREKEHHVALYFSPAQYAAYRTAVLNHGAKPPGGKSRGLAGQEAALMKILKSVASAGA